MGPYALTLIDGPSEEPVTRGEAKSHLGVEHSNDDSMIDSLIEAARQACEVETGRQFCLARWEMRLDAFPTSGTQRITVPRPPLWTVESIQYINSDGNLTTFGPTEYLVDKNSEPGRIKAAFDKSWPEARDEMGAVRVTFLAGYAPYEVGSPTDYAHNVPKAIKQAILLTVGDLYMNRENVNIGNIVSDIPGTAKMLLLHHRVVDFDLSA